MSNQFPADPAVIQSALIAAYSMVPMPTVEQMAAENLPFSPAEYREALVAEQAKQLLMSTSPGGRLFADVAPVANGEKVFRSIVAGVSTEASSGRVIVTLHSRVSDRTPDGTETIRTEHLSNPFGRVTARIARDLIGHKVLVFGEMQEMTGRAGQKVRVLKGLKDLGTASQAEIDALRSGTTANAA
ncbi:hypothetical protein [Branchiibius sp. NY16-3462-2]|uniref:Uncharacterized protein n=1 Tax=Branchiibius cervicis TaxID=908252 RepID=A0ABW2AU34_9MICO|nr:hypothetical protein [Branchiibius sp. NY16-3462-2]KYH43887.1 hypothetical protein AZH51_15755 [Branchiibius sp. NY16-3462-2]